MRCLEYDFLDVPHSATAILQVCYVQVARAELIRCLYPLDQSSEMLLRLCCIESCRLHAMDSLPNFVLGGEAT
jgi:hypothetical protein